MSRAGKKLVGAAKQARALVVGKSPLAIQRGKVRLKPTLRAERLEDSLDGVTAELASALGVIWRRADAEGRTWVFLNFPGWARIAAIYGEYSSDPYVKFQKRRPSKSEAA